MPAPATSGDWMSRTWGGKREMGFAINKHIGDFQAALGLSAGDVTEIQNLAKELMDVIDYYDQAKAVANGLGEWRDDALITGDGGALPNPPLPGTFATVAGPVTGVLKALRTWREKWVVADGYTQAIGETLKVGTPQGDGFDPATVKPDLECATAMSGHFDFSAVIGNRGDSDACDLSACVVGTANYQLLATFTGKATTGHWPAAGTQPVQLQVKAQLKRKNQNYGIPSDPFVVTVIP